MNSILKLVFPFLILAIFGCGPKGPVKLYDGDKQDSEIARIAVARGVSATFYRIETSHGYQMPKPLGSSEGLPVNLLPGEYKAMVTFIRHGGRFGLNSPLVAGGRATYSTQPHNIAFNVKAGKLYKLQADSITANSWRATLIETDTGNLVSKPTKIW